MLKTARTLISLAVIASGVGAAYAQGVVDLGDGVPTLKQLRDAFEVKSIEFETAPPPQAHLPERKPGGGSNIGRPTESSVANRPANKPTSDMSRPRGVSVPIEFALNSAEVDSRFYPHLETIAEYLGEKPDLRLRIVGHTDARGSSGYNKELSELRAQSVAALLVREYKIPSERLFSEGRGEETPRYGNGHDPRNRRVEFLVLP